MPTVMRTGPSHDARVQCSSRAVRGEIALRATRKNVGAWKPRRSGVRAIADGAVDAARGQSLARGKHGRGGALAGHEWDLRAVARRWCSSGWDADQGRGAVEPE